MDLLRLRPPITDEKQVYHCGPESASTHGGKSKDDSLFLISSKGMPRHWTTSVNSGDTGTTGTAMGHSPSAAESGKAHGLSFPIVIFATIFFSTVFLFTNFLSLDSAACSSARNSCTARPVGNHHAAAGQTTHLDLASLEELGILAGLRRHRGRVE